MEFLLLGPVQARLAGRSINVGVRKQRLVLAVLCLDVNRHVSVERLNHVLWPDDPPPTARGMIHSYISGLRAVFANLGVHPGEIELDKVAAGYMLRCDPTCIDIHRFHRLVTDARESDDDEQRVELLERALALWRGAALGGEASEEVRERLCAGVEEARLAALEDLFEVRLRVGRDDVQREELVRLTVQHPHRPRLAAALMRTWHRDGRSAEALQAYQTFRRRLSEAHGLDPPAELHSLQLAILRNDPALGRRSDPSTRSGAPVVPRQLPADLKTFTGRAAELERLLADVQDGRARRQSTALVIDAIDGMAGVGKTSLAVHAAHRLADRFADGQLFIDLHGFTQGMSPATPQDALDQMLRSLGVPGDQIPHALEARAALYRTVLAEKHMLIVLDNAAGEAQVEPLLPGAAGCFVLITSRRRLIGLGDARPISLDVLSPQEALALFTRIAGEDRSDEAAREIVDLCAGLPLAIRIAAARLRSRPGWTTVHLAERLRDHQHRLGELEAGQRSVTASIELSYRQLDPGQQRLYRLLGLHPGPDIDTYAAAALADLGVRDARHLLDGLIDAHLLQEPNPGRYRFHDLLRTHAAQTVARDEPVTARHTALTRLLDHYAHAAAGAMDLVYPFEIARRPQVVPTPRSAPPLENEETATAWLDAELSNVLAAANHAADNGWPGHALALSAILHRHLYTRAHYAHTTDLHAKALKIARAAGNPANEARALCDLGAIQWLRGRYDEGTGHFESALAAGRSAPQSEAAIALDGLGHIHLLQGKYEPAAKYYREALDHARTTGGLLAEAEALWGLGHVRKMQGRYQESARSFQQAVEIARSIGYRLGELQALYGVGQIHRLLGEHELASTCYQQALEIARATGDRVGEFTALRGIGHAHIMQDQLEPATTCFEESLAVAHSIGQRVGQLHALRGLGNALRLRGLHVPAAQAFEQSLAIAREIGDRTGQLRAVHGLARTHQATGSPGQARREHQTALDLAYELGSPDDQARALDGLAQANIDLGEHELARRQWRQALDILAGLGLDRTDEISVDEIRARLESHDRKK